MVGTEDVFAYGTLMLPEIVRALLGRLPEGEAARLAGYIRHPIRGEAYPGVIAQPDAAVDGVLWHGLHSGEMALLDAWEGPYYERRRIAVRPCSAIDGPTLAAWAWVVLDHQAAVLEAGDWSATAFREHKAALWIESCGEFCRARARLG